ncbi:MAG: HD domain-containing protein, partial [Deltaproteobacteria bacterium]|nr:HD domain-containing protein [Deltaproteobacteria bacterium]
DHITHRVLHVQLVSKISRTIGRFLGLNEDLIEAIALGHDIGHCPFGHDGEKFLSALCVKAGIGPYLHNVQSVRFLEKIERKGRGLNLTLQVLDGILCHDGEIHTQALRPQTQKSFPVFDREVSGKITDPSLALTPMTLEGCVVRMADTISYIGRDIEDAIRLGLIKRNQIPGQCVACLGNTNGSIVYNLVTDLIANSLNQPFVAFSDEVSAALSVLRTFNLEAIYLNPKIKPQTGKIGYLFQRLFEQYLNDLKQGDESSIIFSQYLKDMNPNYRERTSPAEIVRDFIAGMTDAFFLKQFPKGLRPKRLQGTFSNGPPG